MEYTEVDIRLKEVSPYSDILVARLNEIEFESYAEYEFGLKKFVNELLEDLSINQKNKKSLTSLALDLIEEGIKIKKSETRT